MDCDPTSYNMCEKLDEFIHSFEKSKDITTVSGKHDGIKETRCYIYSMIQKNKITYHIYGTHLDVASEDERLNQINKIINDSTKYNKENNYIIILGDFNTNDLTNIKNPDKTLYFTNNKFTKNNTKVINHLNSNMFKNIFEEYDLEMTTWSNIITDFIFIKNGNNDKIKDEQIIKGVWYTDASDHLPLLLCLKN